MGKCFSGNTLVKGVLVEWLRRYDSETTARAPCMTLGKVRAVSQVYTPGGEG